MNNVFKIKNKLVGKDQNTYFIADIAANHDGELARAKDLIFLAAEAGADAAKFQNFRASKIVSDYGFRKLGTQQSHQAKWKKSVYEVYQDASLNWEWTKELKETCDKANIHYFSSPYDLEAVDMLEPFVPAYKIGSGDITWPEILRKIAQKQKPVILSTGASTLEEVQRAVDCIVQYHDELILMQCNTNYTASIENFKYINLNVLKTYQKLYPDVILGLSDHSKTCTSTLGAIALGAKVIEKHFTDNNSRQGPDHLFSLNPKEWQEMIERTRELEAAMGDGFKRVEDNEKETVVLQRRCIRAARDLKAGVVLQTTDVEILRPAPPEAYQPYEIEKIIGKKLKKNWVFGEALSSDHIENA